MTFKKMFAEGLGVFALVLFGAGAILANSVSNGGVGILGIALAHGLAIALMAYAVGSISGGHFNPAVTAAFFALKKIDSTTAVKYVLAQLAGGLLASLVLAYAFTGTGAPFTNAVPGLGTGVNLVAGILIEAILTFFLVSVILTTAVFPRENNPLASLAPLLIGLTISADILVGGVLTGAAMNPARAFGPAVVAGHYSNHLVYWLGPIAGALLAVGRFAYWLNEKQTTKKLNNL